MMSQILKKLFLVLLCLSLLSSFAFADDLTILEDEQFNTFGNLTAADYGVKSVSYSVSITVYALNTNGTYGTYVFPMSSDSPSHSESLDKPSHLFWRAKYTVGTVVIPAGTLTVDLPFTCSVSTSASGATASVSGTTLTVVSDGTSSPIPLSFNDNLYEFPKADRQNTLTLSSSFVPADPVDPGPGPGSSGVPSGSMNGIQGWRSALSSAYQWETYNQYIGVRKIMYSYSFQGPDGGSNWTSTEVEGEEILYDMAVAISLNGYKWKIDPVSNDIVFYGYDGGMAKAGSWLDMVFRYLTYDYYWGTRLWSNDVSDSWFGSISSSFSYLNYRVNQILDVLANDEDLAIKDATTPEREWVKGYFTGSGDKADADKYDKLNNTGSAFKDAFAGAPDSSIADGFTAVNDNGYEFWSQGVSDDINGNSASSSGVTRAPAYVPPEQRIVDAYSENWAQIVGGYYD